MPDRKRHARTRWGIAWCPYRCEWHSSLCADVAGRFAARRRSSSRLARALVCLWRFLVERASVWTRAGLAHAIPQYRTEAAHWGAQHRGELAASPQYLRDFRNRLGDHPFSFRWNAWANAASSLLSRSWG